MGLFQKIFGDMNSKELKRIEKIADKVEALDSQMQALTDEELRGKTTEFRKRLGVIKEEGAPDEAKYETLDDILPEAFAVCREAASRSLGMKHFRVQIIGGIVLHEGNIAEMRTGEGKTLVATLPVYLNALEGKGVHVVTVNDYLAKRDMEWMGKLYTFLGLTIGCVIHEVTKDERRKAYLADITYGTNNEFGFDYLRDNMVVTKEAQMQRPLNYAIVDEVDSILIDEARTPLIISGMGGQSTDLYRTADSFVSTLHGRIIDSNTEKAGGPLGMTPDELNELNKGYDFTVDEKEKTVSLTDEGVEKAEAYFNIENFTDPEHMDINHHVLIALKAHNIMKRDIDYIVDNGEVHIVDEFTGRIMYGRRYSDGLHQAIEAKEGIEVKSESKTLATITLQNYFRMYQKLAGMTGTAKTEEDEFSEIYNMNVIVIPTNKPIARVDAEDSVYMNQTAKYKAVVQSIIEHHKTGQPVLVGTVSVEKSELLSSILKKTGVPHSVLNAKQHMKEAEIIAQAGRLNAVTIATNMAGRGTDIILGGNPEFEAKKEMRKLGYDEDAISYASSFVPLEDPALIEAREKYNQLLAQFKAERKPEQEQVIALGGLHIIGTERHEARRIDNQLRGRSGRQGDPGSSQFFVALDDDLMRLFGGEKIQTMMSKLDVGDMPIEAGMLTKTIENAQKKVESRNYAARRYVLQYDDVMNRQRTTIYSERNRVLQGENLRDHVSSMMKDISQEIAQHIAAGAEKAADWDDEELYSRMKFYCDYIEPVTKEELSSMKSAEQLAELVDSRFEAAYAAKEAEVGAPMRDIERMILLRVVDLKWMDHIDAMDDLKDGIGLRALGQQDPARAYADEGADMFELMVKSICDDMIRFCFHVTLTTNAERKQVITVNQAQENKTEASSALEEGPKNVTTNASTDKPQPIRVSKTPGRNDPCPCGSGKKYKNCCGRNQ